MNIPNTFAINIGMYNEKYLNILRKVYLKYNIWENYLYNFDKYLFTINYYDDKIVSNTENKIENITRDLFMNFFKSEIVDPIIIDDNACLIIRKEKDNILPKLNMEEVTKEDFEYFNYIDI